MRFMTYLEDLAEYIPAADVVVSMGGYNTICEILSFEKHALIVPRVHPEPEQWIRARRLQEMGLVEVLRPEALSPDTLSAWLARDLGTPPPSRSRVDLGALTRIPGFMAELLGVTVNGAGAEPTRALSASEAGLR